MIKTLTVSGIQEVIKNVSFSNSIKLKMMKQDKNTFSEDFISF